jgi:hypothetical protein
VNGHTAVSRAEAPAHSGRSSPERAVQDQIRIRRRIDPGQGAVEDQDSRLPSSNPAWKMDEGPLPE